MATPPQYVVGSVKQDPETLAVAVRTNMPEDPYIGHAWAVMTVDRGGHYAEWEEIQNWTDLSIPTGTKDDSTDERSAVGSDAGGESGDTNVAST